MQRLIYTFILVGVISAAVYAQQPDTRTIAPPNKRNIETNWPQYGFDPEHTSFNGNETLVGSGNVSGLKLAWTYNFPCSTYSSPAVVGGILYTGSYCGDFEAV